jgi:UDP-N-acetylmuramoyl-L-alanyl-D-glutamate--2,6-diaminopimelate ligase
MLSILKKIIPKKIFRALQPAYHYLLALVGALVYRFPSRKILVIGVTGTKGKSTTTEMLYHIFKAAGYKVALQNTIHFIIGENERRNLFKMTMPGRFFIQKFLRDAVSAGCGVAILEMSSEGAKQYRHKFVALDALVFTNLSPEHIESHGSYEKYVDAKLSIARELVRRSAEKPSPKVLGSLRSTRLFSKVSPHFEQASGEEGSSVKKVWPNSSSTNSETRGLFEESFLPSPAIVANIDDKEAEKFLALDIETKIPYSLKDATNVQSDNISSSFEIEGVPFHTSLPGVFNVYNMLGAIKCAEHFGVSLEDAKKGLESMQKVRGRMEKVDEGQGFEVVVDYAHTTESLKAIYSTYKDLHTICILGNTGGGRDKWKRPEMAKVADTYCSEIILTNEDPYDEDPMQIINDMKVGIESKPLEVILDRREAIRRAVEKASHVASAMPDRPQDNQKSVAVLITGKGTDPYIMGPNGTKQKWDDAEVAREELRKIK